MNQFFTNINRRLSRISRVLSEGDGSNIPHPEDAAFMGASEAEKALQCLIQTAQNPKSITIKLDGKIALIFGRDSSGKFIVVDKHMFKRKDGTGRQIYSPQDFYNYDVKRGSNRRDLYGEIEELWPNLERAYGSERGYLYWGDLLFSKPLTESSGFFTFKGNSNGITYQVEVHSQVGKFLSGKKSAIAVSQYLPSSATSLKQAQTLNGGIGRLQNNSDCAILPTSLPVVPRLTLDKTLVETTKKVINANRRACDTIAHNSKIAGLFQTFINQKVRDGDLRNLTSAFDTYALSKGIDQTTLVNCSEGIRAVFEIWLCLYNCKQSLLQQIKPYETNIPIKGYLNNGTPSQEGYVSNGYKLVNRLGFSRQNLNGNR